jgi:lactoylglutathione lyase
VETCDNPPKVKYDMPTKVDLNFSKLQHIGIPVRSLDHTTRFYDLLGFEEVMRKPFSHVEGQGICVMMQKGDIMLEFYQLPPSVIEREVMTRKDGQIDHVAFDVPDIDVAFDTLKTCGFAPLQDAPVHLDFWEKGVRFFHIVGPDGERLEFNQVLS